MSGDASKSVSYKCKACGACCKEMIFDLPGTNKHIIDFYETRGLKPNPSSMTINVPARCPHLMYNNKCNIYDDRPDVCILFPYNNGGTINKRLLPKGCAYEE